MMHILGNFTDFECSNLSFLQYPYSFYNFLGTQIPLVPIFASLHVVRRLLRRHAFSPLFGMSFVLSFADDDVRHCESKQMTETRTKA